MISEEKFKGFLNMVWHTIGDTQMIINALEAIGLDVNPSDRNNQPVPFGGLYDMQTVSTNVLLDAVGITKDFKNGGNTRSTVLEELDQFLFDLYTQYPVEDGFPQEEYQALLDIFTSAGAVLPWQQESLIADKGAVRLHRALVKSNSMPVKGYLWQGNDHVYITPSNNGISYDEKEQRINAFALEVYPETVSVSLNTTDSEDNELFDGDTVSADGEVFTLKLSEPETLCRLARCQHEHKKIMITERSYHEFMKKEGLFDCLEDK